MSKMTIVQLGVVVFAICLSTQQVVSQNNTATTAGANSTSTSNSTTTTMATDTYSSANSTSPTGAGVSLHAGSFSFLIPIITAASLLQRYC